VDVGVQCVQCVQCIRIQNTEYSIQHTAYRRDAHSIHTAYIQQHTAYIQHTRRQDRRDVVVDVVGGVRVDERVYDIYI
jgi:predicted ATP-dependent serine protease